MYQVYKRVQGRNYCLEEFNVLSQALTYLGKLVAVSEENPRYEIEWNVDHIINCVEIDVDMDNHHQYTLYLSPGYVWRPEDDRN